MDRRFVCVLSSLLSLLSFLWQGCHVVGCRCIWGIRLVRLCCSLRNVRGLLLAFAEKGLQMRRLLMGILCGLWLYGSVAECRCWTNV